MIANKGKYLIILTGPTAVGKTSLSIRLALKYGAEVFSCDSRQVFRELGIGTAKPSQEELAQVKHHFIDSNSIHDIYSAGAYERDIDAAFAEYFSTRDVAIMVGGTGLYINAAIEGLDYFPDVPNSLGNKLEEDLKRYGLGPLLVKLKRLDPITYATIDKENSRRVLRALAISMVEGKPYSSYLKSKKKQIEYKLIKILLTREREELYQRINLRVDKMMSEGLLEEVKALYPHRNLRSLQTVGYAELFKHLDGEYDLGEAIELIKRNSRRYAKRQMTWFRNDESYQPIPADNYHEVEDFIIRQMR